jgi:hypothetical protein
LFFLLYDILKVMTSVTNLGFDLPDPVSAPTAAAGSGTGSLTPAATYGYKVTYVSLYGETSPSSAVTIVAPSTGVVNLSSIPVSPQTNTNSRKLYRTVANGSTYLLLATIADNITTVYVDGVADGALGAAAPTFNTGASKQSLAGYTKLVNPGLYSVDNGITATAGGLQATAYQLSKELNWVSTVATTNDSIKLPAATSGLIGEKLTIRNNGANTLRIYPFSGQTINGGAADSPVTLAAATSTNLAVNTATNWQAF